MPQRVIVVGAGVVGLTCAVQVAETTDLQVDVLARDLPGESATAFGPVPWLPPPAHLGPEAARWGRTTRTRLAEQATGEDAPGSPGWAGPSGAVTLMPGQLAGSPAAPDADHVQRVSAPVIWPAPYLTRLVQRLLAAGGTLTRMSLTALPPRGLVLNCAGVAARALAGDPEVSPQRWLFLRVADPGLDGWLAGDGWYAVPDGAGVVIAGSDEATASEPTGRATDRSPADPSALLARAARLDPRLGEARVLRQRVALRAYRPGVQLSVRHEVDRTVLHCYGHGGSGVALSWGCAEEVAVRLARLAAQTVPESPGLW